MHVCMYVHVDIYVYILISTSFSEYWYISKYACIHGFMYMCGFF